MWVLLCIFWASTTNNADKSIDFCWAIFQDFIKRPSGVDCKRAASQMSLLLRIWTNAWEHIIQFFLHLNQPDNPGAIKSSLNFDIKKFNSNATNTNHKVYSACIRDPDILRFSILLPDTFVSRVTVSYMEVVSVNISSFSSAKTSFPHFKSLRKFLPQSNFVRRVRL